MAMSSNLTNVSDVVVAAAGTSVAAPAVPDNCHTVIFYNTSTTATAYVSTFATAPAALPAATSWKIPSEGSLTLNIGTITQRAGPVSIVVDGTAALTCQVGYLNYAKNGPVT